MGVGPGQRGFPPLALLPQRVRPAQHLQRIVREPVGLEVAGSRAEGLSGGRFRVVNEEPLLLRSLQNLLVELGAPDHAGGLLLRRAYDHRGILSAVGLVVVERPQEPYQGSEDLYLSGFFAHTPSLPTPSAPFTQLSAMAASYPPNILRHRDGAVQHSGCRLPRTPLLGTWVNKGTKEGRGPVGP